MRRMQSGVKGEAKLLVDPRHDVVFEHGCVTPEPFIPSPPTYDAFR